MALVLPTVGPGAARAMYPMRRTDRLSTKIAVFHDQSEQRYPEISALNEYRLTYTSVSKADADNLTAFFNLVQTQQQPFTFTQTVAGTNFLFDTINCFFTGNVFSWTETFEGQFSGGVTFRAAQPAGPPLTVRTAFPTLFFSLFQQFPIERGFSGNGYVSRLKCGAVYAAPIAPGQFGWPRMIGKRTWKWPLVLNKTQLSTLETFWLYQMGQHGSFTFTDPLYPTPATCRFATDTLDVQFVGVNNIQTTVQLVEDI